MSVQDHFAALIIAIVLPLLGYYGFQRMMVRVRRGIPIDRTSMYRRTIVTNWMATGVLAWLWVTADRGAAQLGLVGSTKPGLYLAAGICLAALALLLLQLRSLVRANATRLRRVAGELGRLRLIVPHTKAELHLFFLVAITAGVVEELFWRGFLFWYLEQSLPRVTTAILITVGFGLAHAYQGWRNVPKITLVGAVFTLLYMLSGSLWPSIILHAAVDIIQGQTAFEVLRRGSDQKSGDP